MLVGDDISFFGDDDAASSSDLRGLLLDSSWAIDLRGIFEIKFYVFADSNTDDRFLCMCYSIYQRGLKGEERGSFKITHLVANTRFQGHSHLGNLMADRSSDNEHTHKHEYKNGNSEQGKMLF